MSKKIYTCDACHYTFEAETGCDQCPDCGKKIEVFGKSKIDAVAKELGIPVLCKLPIDPDEQESKEYLERQQHTDNWN